MHLTIVYCDQYVSWNTLVHITFLMTMSPFFVVNFPILTAEDWGNWSARAARAAGLAAAPSSAALTISVKLSSNTEIRGNEGEIRKNVK